MKVKELKVVADTYADQGLTLDVLKLINVGAGGEGVFRGAHNLQAQDFDNFRLDHATGAEEDKVLFDNVAKAGSLPKGTKPVLMLAAGDFDYTPIQGEHMIVYRVPTEDFAPAVMQGMLGGEALVAGQVDGKGWQLQLHPSCLVVPIRLVTDAGLVTISAADHCLPGLDDDQIVALAEQLAAKGLTFNDLYLAKQVPADQYELTKFYKKLGKKLGLGVTHDLVASLVAGEPVDLPKARPAPKAAPKAKPAAKEEAKPAAKKTPAKTKPAKEEAKPAAKEVDLIPTLTAMKGAAFNRLYTAICDFAKVATEDRKSKRAEMIAHAETLNSAKLLAALKKAGEL